METVFVTGGCGFIGSAVVRALIAGSDTRVINIDKLTYAGRLESLGEARGSDRHVHHRMDICDGGGIADLFKRYQPTTVFHLAAESHVDRSIDGPQEFVRTNVLGTTVLLEAGHAYWRELGQGQRARFRFMHVSTDEVFGALGAEGSFTETTHYEPSSPYAASKAGADHLARAWGTTFGLPVIVTNCSNNYGPYQFPEKLIPLTIGKALRGESIPVYGRGDNVRDWLHVDDHVRGLLLAARRGVPGETYLFGGTGERTNLWMVKRICELVDRHHPASATRADSLISFVADRPGHDFRYSVNAGRAREALGWAPQVGLDEGLGGTVDWYVAHQKLMSDVYNKDYVGQRLGLGGVA